MDKRLEAIASRVRRGCRLADIGTDHAYLPIYLIRHSVCSQVIATDVNECPLSVAAQNIRDHGLQDHIILRLGDGLSVLAPEEVDDIVVAGMGGDLIVSLLKNAPFIRSPQYRLILQPMSRPENLREFLLTNGFDIENEEVLCQGDKLYTIMQAVFADAAPVTDASQYYIGKLPKSTPPIYWERVSNHLKQCLQGAKKRKDIIEQRKLEKVLDAVIRQKERTNE